jgi:hypothetical protein
MKKQGKGKKKKAPSQEGAWGSIRLGGFSAVFPKPSLPRLLGTNSLAAGSATYPRVYLDLPMTATSLALSSGALSTYVNVAGALIPNFVANWGNVFSMFTILGARLEARVTVCASGQGLVLLGFSDESVGSAVGSALAYLPHIELPIPASLVNQPEVQRLDWLCRTPNDLQFYATSNAEASTSIQAYAATATTFTGASTSATIVITGTLRVCFQGYSG